MPEHQPQVDEVFDEALRRAAGPDRAGYLDEVCGGDPELRRRVERLLRAVSEAGSFLETPAQDPSLTADQPPVEGPGTVIGPYKLSEQVGEGGMGSVWMAQQQEPVKRLVAVKLIKAGMDSKQVIARFEAERQALALMDHPNIARVLDAGTTGAGRPYFVMDLVKGVPITRYCDEHCLTPRQRLELFIPVCQAVQHAHQKGIIHRDLKPSNVLVALYDDKPVPKVIDFGVAKAAGHQLTEKTLVTGFGNIVGTLEYMSPEQAELNNQDIDTRSDVYALGVLLYELLAGGPPFARQELEKAGVLEMLRVIREEEPSKPSAKLSTADRLPTLAANRGTEPAKLTRLVRGELDWIVMKALEKDRSRRYETANGLVRDVQRYLADEPVEACPPSAAYRLRKVAWKYRKVLLTAAAFAALLLSAGAVTTWQAVRLAQTERDQAQQRAKRTRDVQEALSQATALRAQALLAAGDLSKWAEARAIAGRAEALLEGAAVEPGLGEQVRTLLGELDAEEKDRRMVAVLEDVRLRQAEVHEGRFDWQAADPLYAEAFRAYGVDVMALPTPEAAVRIRRPAIRQELLAALDDWRSLSRPDRSALLRAVADGADDNPWRIALRETIARQDKRRLQEQAVDPQVLQQPPAVVLLLASALDATGLAEESLVLLRKVQQRHPHDFWANHHLAFSLMQRQPQRMEEAVRFYQAALALRPNSPGVRLNFGSALQSLGRLDDAAAEYREALRLKPDYAEAHCNLGIVLGKQDKPAESLAELREALRLRPNLPEANSHLAEALLRSGDYGGAVALLRQAIRGGVHDRNAHCNLGLALAGQGQVDEAIAAYHEAIRLQPDLFEAHFNLGSILSSRKGDHAGAAAAYREATRLRPRHAEAHCSLGISLCNLGKLGEAEPSFRQAIRLNPNLANAHYGLGWVLCDSKNDNAGAVAAFRETIRLQPDFAEAHCNLGLALGKLGRPSEAVAAAREAVRLKPDLANAHGVLGLALLDTGDVDGAVAACRRAVELAPTRATSHHDLGKALRGKGDREGAIAAFRKALEIAPGFAVAKDNLNALLEVKRQQGAKDPQ